MIQILEKDDKLIVKIFWNNNLLKIQNNSSLNLEEFNNFVDENMTDAYYE